MVRVGLLGAAALVDGSGGKDSNHTESGTSIGDAVALLGGWLGLNDISKSDGREYFCDCHGIVDCLGGVTNFIDKRQGMVIEVFLHLTLEISLKVLELLHVAFFDLFHFLPLLHGFFTELVSPLLDILVDSEVDDH